MYQRQGKAAYKANLDNTWKLANYLNNPEKGFKTVHVAGTNGKGSTSHMLASILQEAGYKVGLYTSPHLKDFRERIKVSGELIGKDEVVNFVAIHHHFFEENSLSFFEMTVGMAFDYFNKQKVDIAIVEVGLGGRLDSTNIIIPEVSVITNIGLDHTQFLGNSLEKIAGEKAGIIKPEVPVVIGEATAQLASVFKAKAASQNSPIFFAQETERSLLKSDLLGDYQKKNQQTTLKTIELLIQGGWKISEQQLKKGLQNVVRNTGLLGRWQVLNEHPKVICDTAHNREGLNVTIKQLAREKFDKLHIVLGFVSDKTLETVLPLFPEHATYYWCAPKIARAKPVDELAKIAFSFMLKGDCFNSVQNAYTAALNASGEDDVIYIGGSTFVVAEVL